MDAFQQAVEDRLAEQLLEEICTPDSGREGTSNEVHFQQIKAGIAKARLFGLIDQSSVSIFVELLYIVGPSFYQHTLISPFFNQKALSSEASFEDMLATITPQQWENVAASNNDNDWQLIIKEYEHEQ